MGLTLGMINVTYEATSNKDFEIIQTFGKKTSRKPLLLLLFLCAQRRKKKQEKSYYYKSYLFVLPSSALPPTTTLSMLYRHWGEGREITSKSKCCFPWIRSRGNQAQTKLIRVSVP